MASQSTEVPPPLQDLPDAKTRKYDRQLRLWGASGQVALEETHILLINNGPGVTGVETLKNLVLPGIGQFTILDSAIVSEADLGVNFFLEDASLGKSRAEETCRLLMELNPDVKGHAITESLHSWLSRADPLAPYTFVLIAAPIDPTHLASLEKHFVQHETPTIYLHCLGFYSQFSLYLPPAFPIVETHPDPTATIDLRLLKPWPELEDFAIKNTTNMDQMNGEEFAHIPWICLLLHYLSEWKATHDGKPPQTYQEKSAFRTLVRAGSQTEENFDEACAAVLKSLNAADPPSSTRDILLAEEAQSLHQNSPPFWIIAKAVHDFWIAHGELPLPGAVPDMKARSDTYLQLQTIYKAKARKDCAWITAAVRKYEQTLQIPASRQIDEKEIENSCKNASHLALVRGRPFKIPSPNTPLQFADRAKSLAADLSNPESLLPIYLAFLAWDLFTANPAPTSSPADDAAHLTSLAHTLLDDLVREAGGANASATAEARDAVGKVCIELARAARGGAELHNVASLTGGLVAQEVIKVITRQYVPVDNTALFDGVFSRSGVLRV